MGTPYQKIYEAFLVKLPSDNDEWDGWLREETEEDMRHILESAIPYFKFPRISLERNENGFTNELKSEEIEIIATYMKCEWLNRQILSLENIGPQYDERDYSPANQLAKLNELLKATQNRAAKLESFYYRSIQGKPFKYSQWATSNG